MFPLKRLINLFTLFTLLLLLLLQISFHPLFLDPCPLCAGP